MQWHRFAIFILIVAIVQAGLINVVAVTDLNIKPDLFLIFLVFFAVYYNTSEAIIISFTIGFAADIASSSIMGTQIISFGLLGTLLAYLNRVIAIRKMPYQSAVIFITGLLSGLLVICLTKVIRKPPAPDIFKLFFWTSLYSALVGPFLFLPSAWWMRIKKHKA